MHESIKEKKNNLLKVIRFTIGKHGMMGGENIYSITLDNNLLILLTTKYFNNLSLL